MNPYQAKSIINLAVAGHGSSGKTSLAEAMLYLAGASDRRGKVDDGNTVCDYDPEEVRRRTSISAAVAPVEWKNKKINLLDAPGLFDFEGGLCEAMRAADTVLIVISGKTALPWERRRPLRPHPSRIWRRFSLSTACAMRAPGFIAYLRI